MDGLRLQTHSFLVFVISEGTSFFKTKNSIENQFYCLTCYCYYLGLVARNPYLLLVHDEGKYPLHVLSVPYLGVFFFCKLSIMGELGNSIFKLVFVAQLDGFRNTDLSMFTRLPKLISAYRQQCGYASDCS